MSCIIAYRSKNGNIYMGCDSASIALEDFSISTRNDKKVFLKNDMIFGFANSFRMGQILKYKFKRPDHPKNMDDYEYMCTLFIDAVIKCFVENSFIGTTEEGEIQFDGIFMVGYNKQIYTIGPDFQIDSEDSKFSCIGCGSSYALGAMYALTNNKNEDEIDILNIITDSLLIASNYSLGVRKPFTIFELSGN